MRRSVSHDAASHHARHPFASANVVICSSLFSTIFKTHGSLAGTRHLGLAQQHAQTQSRCSSCHGRRDSIPYELAHRHNAPSSADAYAGDVEPAPSRRPVPADTTDTDNSALAPMLRADASSASIQQQTIFF